MQRCQKCGRTYQDDKQKFCTFDGGRLEVASDSAPTVMDLNQTIQSHFPPGQPPQQQKGVTSPITPPVDLNKTIAGASSAPTSEFQSHVTGPTTEPNSSPSAPLPSSQTPSQQLPPSTPAVASVAAPGGKSSKLPLILGGVAVLLLLGLGAGGVLLWALRDKTEKVAGGGGTTLNTNTGGKVNTDGNANATPAATTTGASSPDASATPPPNSTQFINARSNMNSLLADHFSEFSFYYPRAWSLNSQAGTQGSTNFVKVERLMPPNFTQEEFAVSYYESKGSFEADREVFPVLIEKLDNKFSAGYPEYRKISEGETKVNGIDGYEFRYQGVSRGTAKGDITLWGRVIFLPPKVEGGKNGVTLLIFTTSIAPELKSIEDVGVRGELPVILNSFKLGQ